MGINGILFNPQGRINAPQFWRGIIILLAISLVISVASLYAPLAIASALGFVSLLLLYPAICVYGKRFHDTGRTAWLVLAVAAASIALTFALSLALTPIFAGDLQSAQLEMQEQLANGEITLIESLERIRELSRGGPMVASILTSVITTLSIAFFVARLESDPDENEHGPATANFSTFD